MPSRPSSPLGRSVTKLYGKLSSRFPKGKKDVKETPKEEESAATEEPAATAEEPAVEAPKVEEEETQPVAAPVESAPVVTASA